jgi:hypothetical protein
MYEKICKAMIKVKLFARQTLRSKNLINKKNTSPPRIIMQNDLINKRPRHDIATSLKLDYSHRKKQVYHKNGAKDNKLKDAYVVPKT